MIGDNALKRSQLRLLIEPVLVVVIVVVAILIVTKIAGAWLQ